MGPWKDSAVLMGCTARAAGDSGRQHGQVRRHAGQHVLRLERFVDHGYLVRTHELSCTRTQCVAGDGDHAVLQMRVPAREFGIKGGAVEARHLEVGQHEIERLGIEAAQRIQAVVGQRDVVAGRGEDVAQDFGDVHLIVDDQDACAMVPVADRPLAAAVLRMNGGRSQCRQGQLEAGAVAGLS